MLEIGGVVGGVAADGQAVAEEEGAEFGDQLLAGIGVAAGVLGAADARAVKP